MGDTEMQSLIEIKKEVEIDIKIGAFDEQDCIDLYEKGNLIAGYALWLAKEKIHKDSQTGWLEFLKKIGVSKSIAYDKISFYEAKSSALGGTLPNTEKQFRMLGGGTKEEKAKRFTKVKEVIGKDNPTSNEIKIITVIESRGIQNEGLKEEIQSVIVKSSPKVKEAFANSGKKAGIKKVIQAVKEGKGDEEIITIIKGGDSKQKKWENKDTCIEIREQNKELRKEIKAMKREVEDANKKLEDNDIVQDLVWSLLHMTRISKEVRDMKSNNEKVFNKMKPHVEKALTVLQLSTITPCTIEEVKRNYRDLVRKHHPDVSKEYGSGEMFQEIKGAYEVLKGVIK